MKTNKYIIFVFNDYAKVTGGQDSTAFQDFLSLKEKGIPTVLVTGVGPIDSSLQVIPKADHYHFGSKDIFARRFSFYGIVLGLANFGALIKVLSLLSKYQRSSIVCHFHSFTKFFSPLVPLVLLALRFKVVFTINDYFQCCPNGTLFNFRQNAICKLDPMSCHCLLSNCDARSYLHKLWRFFRHFLLINSLYGLNAFSKNFIFVSSFSRNVFLRYFKTARLVNDTIIPNPINFSIKQRVLSEQNSLFIYIGRMVASKGVFLFAESARRLNIPAVFIGDGPLLQSLSQNYGEFTFFGWKDHSFIKENLRLARALVFPSLWYEAEPLVPKEALIMGVPVITSNINASIDIIQHGINGLHFDPYYPESLDSCLLLMKDNFFVKALSQNAFQTFSCNIKMQSSRTNSIVKFYKNTLKYT